MRSQIQAAKLGQGGGKDLRHSGAAQFNQGGDPGADPGQTGGIAENVLGYCQKELKDVTVKKEDLRIRLLRPWPRSE